MRRAKPGFRPHLRLLTEGAWAGNWECGTRLPQSYNPHFVNCTFLGAYASWLHFMEREHPWLLEAQR